MSTEQEEAALQAKLYEAARVLGETLSAHGVPFLCIIGCPSGDSIRCSGGMEFEENRNVMCQEAVEYINFLTSQFS